MVVILFSKVTFRQRDRLKYTLCITANSIVLSWKSLRSLCIAPSITPVTVQITENEVPDLPFILACALHALWIDKFLMFYKRWKRRCRSDIDIVRE